MSMTSSCSPKQSSPPGKALIRDLAWLRVSLRSFVCVTIGTQQDALRTRSQWDGRIAITLALLVGLIHCQSYLVRVRQRVFGGGCRRKMSEDLSTSQRWKKMIE